MIIPGAEEKIAEYIRMNPWRCVQQFGNGLRGMGNPALWNAGKLGMLCSRNAPRPKTIPKASLRHRRPYFAMVVSNEAS